jgi:hypothetical protein
MASFAPRQSRRGERSAQKNDGNAHAGFGRCVTDDPEKIPQRSLQENAATEMRRMVRHRHGVVPGCLVNQAA